MASQFSRRSFLGKAALAVGFPTIVPSSVLGLNGKVAPSNRIVMGGIGIGPRGRQVLTCFLAQPDIQFVAIADVQADRRETVRRMANRHYGNEDCYKCRDMYEILERDDIDVVQITTGDRWHTLGTILACKAGKDVYCEKPCTLSIAESRELAETVNRYGRVFQAGTQRRNVDNFRFAANLAQTGKLGKLHTVHASILTLREDHSWLPAEPEPDPEVVDWNRWLGPAPWRPFNKRYVQGRWRGYYDFNPGATLPEWGAHTIDLCQWAAGKDDTTPVEFEPIDATTIHAKYADGLKLVLRLAGFRGEGNWVVPGTCPVRFEGEEGWVETADHGKIGAEPKSLLQNTPPETAGTDPIKHVRDFVNCVKSREKPAANADAIRKGHITCYAAAISWKLGRKLRFDPDTEMFIGDDEANRMRSRARRAPWHA